MLKSSYDFLECSDKSSKFNSFAFTPSAVLYLRVIGGTNFFVHWWMKGIYFASFYFRVWDLTREIRENKKPAKISTYTVFHQILRVIGPRTCVISTPDNIAFSVLPTGWSHVGKLILLWTSWQPKTQLSRVWASENLPSQYKIKM